MLTVVLAAVVAGLMSLPYMIVSSPAIIWRSFQGTFSMYPQVTFNAWNPWYMLCMAYGHWISDAATVFGISYKTIGVGAFILAAVAIAVADQLAGWFVARQSPHLPWTFGASLAIRLEHNTGAQVLSQVGGTRMPRSGDKP